jgi:hypothetical protein
LELAIDPEQVHLFDRATGEALPLDRRLARVA